MQREKAGFPPAVAHSLKEAVQVETSQSVLFLVTSVVRVPVSTVHRSSR
jgi:hypothetical protein